MINIHHTATLHLRERCTVGNQKELHGDTKHNKTICYASLQRMLLCHLYTRQPLSDSCEALLSCDVIHHNHTISLAKELFGDASISAGEGNRQKRKCYVFTGTLENSDNTHCPEKASEMFSNSHIEVQENKNNFIVSLLLNL